MMFFCLDCIVISIVRAIKKLDVDALTIKFQRMHMKEKDLIRLHEKNMKIPNFTCKIQT